MIKLRMGKYWGQIRQRFATTPAFLRNKYFIASAIFTVWLTFFDNHNLLDRVSYLRELRRLNKDREFYIKAIETDSRKLHELKTDARNLEKFAREEYFMKKDNEEIFIIEED